MGFPEQPGGFGLSKIIKWTRLTIHIIKNVE
jgi:hypothetical protein